jgi:hypothetical protein
MTAPRGHAAGVLLRNSTVLIAGGYDQAFNALSSADLGARG